MEAITLFGPKLSALLALLALCYFLLSFAPVIWPAYRAFRRSSRLPRPWLFVGAVAALTYGAFSFLGFALVLPVQAYTIFIAPQLHEAGLPYGSVVTYASSFTARYWVVLIPTVQLALTWLVTRRLGQRWERICIALAA